MEETTDTILEGNHISIYPGPSQSGGTYNILSVYCKDAIPFTAAGLLELATWIHARRATLESEAAAAREENEGEKSVADFAAEMKERYDPED